MSANQKITFTRTLGTIKPSPVYLGVGTLLQSNGHEYLVVAKSPEVLAELAVDIGTTNFQPARCMPVAVVTESSIKLTEDDEL